MNTLLKSLYLIGLFWVVSLAATQKAQAQCGCTHIIPLNPSAYIIDGAVFKAIDGSIGVKPGDKVCFATGTRPDLLIKNMNGTAANPITITNMCDGQVKISANAGTGRLIYVGNCSYIHFTGAANPSVQYGIEVTSGVMGIDFRDFTTHVEGDHLYVHDIGYAAICAKTDPTCDPLTWRGNGFIMRDVYFHDNYLKNTKGEGFYVGDSHYHSTFPVTCNSVVIQTQESEIMGVEIAYNKLENIGRDGIQVGSAVKPDALSTIKGCFIHHNTINGFGATNEYAQQSGIQINPGTDAEVYNNIVDTGTGFALFAGGQGGSHFYNNWFCNALQGGIICASYIPYDPTGFIFSNNLMVGNSVYGIYMLAESATQNNLFVNNIIVASPSEPGFLYVRLNNPPAIKWTDANNIKTTNLASVKFVDPATKNYHLLTGSPGIDGGQDMTSHAITFDLDEKTRPKGTKFDIGPYEVVPGGPVANAGADQSMTLPTNSIILNGSGTSGTGITGYQWTKKSGPAAGTLTNATTASLSVSGLAQGIYVFELTVTDIVGTDFDDVTVTVLTAAVNQNPTANAGVDKVLVLPTNSITLNGIGTDPDGTISAYAWTKVSGPAATLGPPVNTANLLLTGLVQGAYVFQLMVTDNNGATAIDQVTVTVNTAAVNQSPTISVGASQTLFLPTSAVTITATATDPDGSIATILWVKKSGAAATLGATNGLSLSISGLVAGTYVFRITVTDNQGATAFKDVTITVILANQSPTANAGVNQAITLPTNSTSITGSGNDPDGSITGYAWIKVSGPAATLATANTATLGVTNMVQGTYVFGLTVTDNSGATGYDEMSVAVSVPVIPNELPLAFAGGNYSFSLPTSSVNLYGSGFDPDGTITNYAWVKSSGGTATLTNAASPTLTVTNLQVGVYSFRLTVTDNNGATGKDEAIITVSDVGSNIAPVASAGSDKIIKLPTTSAILDGSGSDADGQVSTYAWSQVSGAAATITTPATPSTSVTSLALGDYVFRLTVTDNLGSTDFNDVTVRVVSSTNNLPPLVNAGPDITIFTPQSAVTLSAIATDDGTIASYQWTKLSGPTGLLVNPTALNLQLQNLIEGNYFLKLTVTDNNGASVFDIVNVSVRPGTFQPPVADAGGDQQITLPTNLIDLTGTASSPTGTISGVLWTKVSGPAATLSNANTLTLQVTNMVAGTYVFKLTATENTGATASDNVQVIVNPIPPNQPPIVDAGVSKAILSPLSSVDLTGTATDSDGTVVSTLWSQVQGPNTATLQNPGTLTLTASGLIIGNYVFRLSATDNNGLVGTSDAIVLVSDSANLVKQLPVVFAGDDLNLVIPDNSVTISGEAVALDASIDSWTWSQVSGNTANISANLNVVNITDLAEGEYVFRLTVIDSDTLSASDDVNISVTARKNDIPKFFSPNNDGIGEFWVFRNVDDYKQCKLSVFSRSGQVVYEAAPYVNTWDGTYHGRPLNNGDYYYNIKCDNGKAITGAVRIIR